MAHENKINIGHGVGDPGYGREVVDGLNESDKRFWTMLMTTLKLPSITGLETQIPTNTSTVNNDMSLSQEFQKHLFHP